MKTPTQLIQNVIGQLQGIQRMLDSDKDCLEILTQLKAAKSALNSLSVKMLSSNLENCASLKSPKAKQQFQKILTELSKI